MAQIEPFGIIIVLLLVVTLWRFLEPVIYFFTNFFSSIAGFS